MPVVHRRRMLSRSSASQIGVVRPVLPRIPNVYVPLRKTASKWLGLAVTSFGLWDFKMMRDEIVIDEKRMRAEFEKMDAAFCTAMLNAIDAGTEHSPEGICKEPGTRRPIVFLAD